MLTIIWLIILLLKIYLPKSKVNTIEKFKRKFSKNNPKSNKQRNKLTIIAIPAYLYFPYNDIAKYGLKLLKHF